MLELLSKILGPNRAVSTYVFVQRWGIPLLLFAGFVLVMGGVVWRSAPDRYEHLAYLQAEVLQTAPLVREGTPGVMVEVRLPDGEVLQLTETEGTISASLTDTACVETRRDTETGALLHRLRLPFRCDG
jgi:hypothetical protein